MTRAREIGGFLALALMLCATVAGVTACSVHVPDVREATEKVDKAEAAYLRIRPYVLMLLPWMPDQRAEQVRAAMAAVERAFAAARLARGADQLAWLREAERLMVPVQAVVE